jgi:hypothetical protein
MPEKTLTKRILDGDFSTLKDDIEGVIAKKIVDKINVKKEEILKDLSGSKQPEVKVEPKVEVPPVEKLIETK